MTNSLSSPVCPIVTSASGLVMMAPCRSKHSIAPGLTVRLPSRYLGFLIWWRPGPYTNSALSPLSKYSTWLLMYSSSWAASCVLRVEHGWVKWIAVLAGGYAVYAVWFTGAATIFFFSIEYSAAQAHDVLIFVCDLSLRCFVLSGGILPCSEMHRFQSQCVSGDWPRLCQVSCTQNHIVQSPKPRNDRLVSLCRWTENDIKLRDVWLLMRAVHIHDESHHLPDRDLVGLGRQTVQKSWWLWMFRKG